MKYLILLFFNLAAFAQTSSNTYIFEYDNQSANYIIPKYQVESGFLTEHTRDCIYAFDPDVSGTKCSGVIFEGNIPSDWECGLYRYKYYIAITCQYNSIMIEVPERKTLITK